MIIPIKVADHSVNHDEARRMIRKAPTGCCFYLWSRVPANYPDGSPVSACGVAAAVKISRAAALELVSELIGPGYQQRGVLINVTTYGKVGEAIEALYVG